MLTVEATIKRNPSETAFNDPTLFDDNSFRVFDHIYVLTGGGPGTQTTSISNYIYKRFFQENALGSAVATSILLLILTLVPPLLLMRNTLRGSGRA